MHNSTFFSLRLHAVHLPADLKKSIHDRIRNEDGSIDIQQGTIVEKLVWWVCTNPEGRQAYCKAATSIAWNQAPGTRTSNEDAYGSWGRLDLSAWMLALQDDQIGVELADITVAAVTRVRDWLNEYTQGSTTSSTNSSSSPTSNSTDRYREAPANRNHPHPSDMQASAPADTHASSGSTSSNRSSIRRSTGSNVDASRNPLDEHSRLILQSICRTSTSTADQMEKESVNTLISRLVQCVPGLHTVLVDRTSVAFLDAKNIIKEYLRQMDDDDDDDDDDSDGADAGGRRRDEEDEDDDDDLNRSGVPIYMDVDRSRYPRAPVPPLKLSASNKKVWSLRDAVIGVSTV